jgi:RNA polymerase sigma-70 factor (ECF subfamily)
MQREAGPPATAVAAKCAGNGHSDATAAERWLVAVPLDCHAFAAIYREYVTPVYRYLYQHVRNPHDAEDLTATTFSRALATLGRYEERGSFAAWLFSVARHTLRDFQRRRRTHVDVDVIAPALVDPAPPPDAQVVQAEQADLLRALIAQLPADQREALVLRIYAGLSTTEVAAVLDRSEGAVKMLVHRAVTRLRDAYDRGELA